ncbi:MAG: histidine phosphatase family protein [Candidatus Binataceae bacterium]|nr:histidine phosphatase family protein [Candidatus Binataceae bacterium]
MATFFLIRHATSIASSNVLSGRSPGITLSDIGRDEAGQLARRFADIELAAIWSSPMERAVETAIPLGSISKLAINQSEHLNEIEYGDWTGMSFSSLAEDPHWQCFNHSRREAEIPGGELISHVQKRVVAQLAALNSEYGICSIAIVTHAEPIRLVLAYCLDSSDYLHDRLEIGPASVSIVRWSERPTVLSVNNILSLSIFCPA